MQKGWAIGASDIEEFAIGKGTSKCSMHITASQAAQTNDLFVLQSKLEVVESVYKFLFC